MRLSRCPLRHTASAQDTRHDIAHIFDRRLLVAELQPQHPAGDIYLATVIWLEHLSKSRRLQTSLYRDESNFYAGADYPNDPKITGVTGWPYKKHHHNHHQNIILNQLVDYAPANGVTTKTVVYIFDNQTFRLYRCVDSAVPGPPNLPDPPGVTTIATDVKDFNVTINDLDETANTSITFQPRFRTFTSSDATTGTTYFQMTLMRNTR